VNILRMEASIHDAQDLLVQKNMNTRI